LAALLIATRGLSDGQVKASARPLTQKIGSPLEVSPNFPPCPARFAQASGALNLLPSGRDGREPDNLKKETFMTDTTTHQPASKKPTLVAYHVRAGKSDKGYWTRIGFNIQLDGLVPLDGRITLRIATDKPD
jgi:hypothetical protein